ncbi:hypothetical protein [Kiloniella sp.]|uniref:hypothetical protein n=1 Tax=Kiloniella sp. TaxID=1938587 RepID=UPI003B027D5E
MSDTSMNERVAKLEGKMEGIEIFLPKLLARFEHMEEAIKADFKELKDDFKGLEQKTETQFKGLEQKTETQFKGLETEFRSSRADRWTQTLTLIGIMGGMLAVSIGIIALIIPK